MSNFQLSAKAGQLQSLCEAAWTEVIDRRRQDVQNQFSYGIDVTPVTVT